MIYLRDIAVVVALSYFVGLWAVPLIASFVIVEYFVTTAR